MSAYMVSKQHIDRLIETAINGPADRLEYIRSGQWRVYYAPGHEYVNYSNANAIGAMLVQENLRSIQYRYPDTISDPSRTPGPLARYWEYPYVFPQDTKALSTLQAFNAISRLDYQSCEHPEWGTSDAHKFLDSLTWALIHALPGYDGADWES